jgi:putative flippase GtrA
LKKYGDMDFPRFLIVGALNTGLTYLLYLCLLFVMPYVWAYSLTYSAGIGLGYLLNSHWVFKKTPNLRSATTYPVVYGINYFLGVAMLWLLVELINIPKEIAPLIIVAVSVPVMYVVTRAIFQGKYFSEKTNN